MKRVTEQKINNFDRRYQKVIIINIVFVGTFKSVSAAKSVDNIED